MSANTPQSAAQHVAELNKCSGCGVCAGVCPNHALAMVVAPNGDLRVQQTGNCLSGCRLCATVCPFAHEYHDPRHVNESLFAPIEGEDTHQAQYHRSIGWHQRSLVGFSLSGHREISASGGLATWALEALLTQGMVSRVAVVTFAPSAGRGKLFTFSVASTVDEIRNAAGSVYHPVDIAEIVHEIMADRTQKWAIVGVPCLCAAIRNVKSLNKSVPYVFGLACGMYQNTAYTELLMKSSGVDAKSVRSIQYRIKPVHNYRFQAADCRKTGKRIAYRQLPFFLGRHAYFRMNACNYCKDVFAEAADACFMDAWLPETANEPDGTSLVVLRNHALDALFTAGATEKRIQVHEVDAEKVVQSQAGQVRRKTQLIDMRLHDSSGINTASVRDRVDWWLQRLTQQRSKKAWASVGSRYGLPFFWLAMLDLVCLQLSLDYSQRLMGKVKRVFRRLHLQRSKG